MRARFVREGNSSKKIPKILEQLNQEGKQRICKGYNREPSCTKVL